MPSDEMKFASTRMNNVQPKTGGIQLCRGSEETTDTFAASASHEINIENGNGDDNVTPPEGHPSSTKDNHVDDSLSFDDVEDPQVNKCRLSVIAAGVALVMIIVGVVLASLTFTIDPFKWRCGCSADELTDPFSSEEAIVVVSDFDTACRDPYMFAFTSDMTCECQRYDAVIRCSDDDNKIFYSYHYNFYTDAFNKFVSCTNENS